MINEILKKFEYIKELLGKQKEFSGKLNETIKTSLANIIATKTNYKNELTKIQDNIKYDIINNNENKNVMNQINDISSSINIFKKKIDSASNIYLNPNTNNINNGNNSNEENKTNQENSNNIIEEKNQNNYGNNRLKKLFSEINGGEFKF